MTILRAHFDGKVIVPDEPLDLPEGAPLEVHIHEMQTPQRKSKNFPTFPVPPGAKPITLEDVKRAEDEP